MPHYLDASCKKGPGYEGCRDIERARTRRWKKEAEKAQKVIIKYKGPQKLEISLWELSQIENICSRLKENGNYTSYYPNSFVRSKEECKNNKNEGNYLMFFENGNPMVEGFYVNGKRNGHWNSYFSTGQLAYEFLYEDGFLKREKYYDLEGNMYRDTGTRTK